MKITTSTVFDILSRLRVLFSDNALRKYGSEEPLRSGLFSSDQMDRHGKVVARAHQLRKYKTPDQLLKRLDDNERTLVEVRNLLVESIRAGKTVTHAAEWLLDNFYLIEEQVVIARKHLPKGYSEGLPCLAEGVSAGMPRVYDIVLEIISHSDGRVDIKSLSSFIASYQSCTLLTLGELWAIPIMLRLAVIENLRRVSGKMALDMIDHNLADYWAERMTTTVKEEPTSLILAIADMARSGPALDSAFVAGFTRNLQGKGPALALPLSWMEQQLSSMGTASNDLVRQENQKQAADQVSVRNSINTLRFIGATNWREFVETLSSVEQELKQDPSGTYPQMDFATRDRYRHVVESISKSSPLSETEVAKLVLGLAGKPLDGQQSVRQAHVGYYLVDKGLEQAEQAAGMRHTLWQQLVRLTRRRRLSVYLLSITFMTLIVAAGMIYQAHTGGIAGWLLLTVTTLLSVSGAAHLAVTFVNWLVTIRVSPELLPRMDFSRGIPTECRTLIAVPTMLSGKEYIEELTEALEIRFLANREANLHFCLLTDFTDAGSETLPEDDDLVETARQGIWRLNQKYKQPGEDIFFLFHRPRTWNAREGKWMGYERKRGKLAALNALLRDKDNNEFSVITGNHEILTRVKYVITLDSDTQLPRETAWKFVATMAHPLNQAIYNQQKKRVTAGYGILQPRVAAALPRTAASLYLRMQGDVSGIDPYTQASSDVYQDLLGEGSFIGKGIYDVDIFEQALHNVFPANRILSHDLLEGCYARSGLLSDVLLYEENPSEYEADVRRHHRWIRGDWQVGAWMMPFVTAGNDRMVKNRLSGLSKWKIFDNLRRSLLPGSLGLLLLAGWLVLPYPWFWSLSVVAIMLLPAITAAGWQLLRKPADLTLRAHLTEAAVSQKRIIGRFLFNIAVLPYEVYKYTDAILRTNWRMIFSRKKLLEWTPSAAASRKVSGDIAGTYGRMWIAPLLSFICAGLLSYVRPEALPVAAPILLLWLAAPALAWWLSRPRTEEQPALSVEQTLFLHASARRTWAFFEQFVTETDNWLPPDNFQEQPVAVIAHRTSPTNIGLALLANLAAYDFGYVSGGRLVSRCRDTLQSMLRMERYRGHFYNWYDTLTLLPLHPRYVSTVDSGNLSGHLLTLRQGFLSLPEQPLWTSKTFEGLSTTVYLIAGMLKGRHSEITGKMLALLDTTGQEIVSLSVIKQQLNGVIALINELAARIAGGDAGLINWMDRLLVQVEDIRTDLQRLTPWTGLLPVPARYAQLSMMDQVPTLRSVLSMQAMLQQVEPGDQPEQGVGGEEWMVLMRTALSEAAIEAAGRIVLLEQLAEDCEELSTISYDFLMDQSTCLLRIGYNVDEQRKDNSYYDLLASEARLGIFVGIAQGKLPQESWFALGRLLTNSGSDPILLSWSGSMFEYLMPQLVMPTFENTLLHQTAKATVKRQIEYAGQRGVPWGISESAYNMVDVSMNYQYRAFGVPGLGLKRGLEEDLVIAPYATMLALMVAPAKACTNLRLLSSEGFEGEYGFFEAIDYTPSRLPRKKSNIVVQSYMAHHQGMSLLSLDYLLHDKPMQQRFMAELRFQATMLLVQERIPRATLFYAHTGDLAETHTTVTEAAIRSINTPHTPLPELQLLSNGRYQVMVTNAGGGYSRWKDIAVTRWREDTTMDDHGIFCYIRDTGSGKFWSNTFQPTRQVPEQYEAVFSQGHVEFRRKDDGIETRTEIVISPEDDTEMRRVRITNKSQSLRTLEITSYAEIVIAGQASDESHPAFSNLFVRTEIIPEHNAIICTRRPRSSEETPPWIFHLMEVRGAAVEAMSFETDRMQFVGRSRTTAHPQAMEDDLLSGTGGPVLDPVMSIRYRVSIKPGQTVTADLIYGMSETEESCQGLIHKYRDQHLKNRAFELSWTHSQVLLRQINATEADAQLYDRLAASVIYPHAALRAEATVLRNNFRGQSGLWSHSVSGDLPIVLLHIHDLESMELVRQMVQAHTYWRLKGLAADLVIWNEEHGSYRQLLHEQILGLTAAQAGGHPSYSRPGSIFVKSMDQVSAEDRVLFESVARVIIHDNKGTLTEQLNRHHAERALPPLLEQKVASAAEAGPAMDLPDDLLFFNGTGGFTPDGREYKIRTDIRGTTPVPWVNVIANPGFGTVISESGSAYTWAVNAHEYRITPWNNDPVTDTGGEAFYLRDEDSGLFWSPSPFPAKGDAPYIITHGFGYSIFEHVGHGISSSMCVFVDKALPVKFIVLKIRNLSGRDRRLSATGFLEIILGDVRSRTNMHILSEQEPGSGALLMRNRYNTAFAGRVSFFRTDGPNLSFTADRSEFIGRNRSLTNPQALHRTRLSGRSGAGMDPCAALQTKFSLPDGAEQEIVFMIGSEGDATAANALIHRFSDADAARLSLERVKDFWNEALGAVTVTTPDPALNMLANGWLTYQNMACRLFARTGFYQSGGAFGFRDQLQDILALLHNRPDLAREHILLSASRQFTEGDVQHWWHPPEGRGVRTRCSDDLLWLPYAVSCYVTATGDRDILSVPVDFLETRPLDHDEDSVYDLPVSGNESGTLYEHCVRALKRSLHFGKHGLPFIGSGDWNDGMDKVGNKGIGESVWLAFFLYDVLMRFTAVAIDREDLAFAGTCKEQAEALQSAIEVSAWDGQWYLRAYFDDGTPLGSHENDECRIDAIAQSWAVLSGAANTKRAVTAMASLDRHLVNRDLKLIQLLDPPFDTSVLNPGYIKGYVPGVRENGGQYSHAAIWSLMAFAATGNRKKVWELFNMINPVRHASDGHGVYVYKAEPYVMAADVYANRLHGGRGGWTWYTGSAGWMYQFIIGSFLGLELRKDQLVFKPCFPLEWPSVSVAYRYGGSVYRITVFQLDEGATSWWRIGDRQGPGNVIDLIDDGNEYQAEVHIGS